MVASAPTEPRVRSLAPREHGAYGQLGVPLAVAFAMARPTLAAALLGASAIAAFVAHEPLLVVIGQRGARALRVERARALQRLAMTAGVAIGLGALGFAFAPNTARIGAVVAALLSAIVAALIARRAEKTASGELLAAAALAALALPVALASGTQPSFAYGAWAVWCASFAIATWAVRSVIAHRRAPVPWPRRVLPTLAPFATAGALAATSVAPTWIAVALAPGTVAAVAVAVRPPHPRALRAVGWALVAATITTGVLMIAAARLAG